MAENLEHSIKLYFDNDGVLTKAEYAKVREHTGFGTIETITPLGKDEDGRSNYMLNTVPVMKGVKNSANKMPIGELELIGEATSDNVAGNAHDVLKQILKQNLFEEIEVSYGIGYKHNIDAEKLDTLKAVAIEMLDFSKSRFSKLSATTLLTEQPFNLKDKNSQITH